VSDLSEQAPCLAFFRIEGAPIAKGRPRVTRSGHTYTPKRTRDWEKMAVVSMRAQNATLQALDEPLRVECRFVFSRPKATPKRASSARLPKPTRPDLDNLVKAVLDAGSKAGLYTDDARVVETLASKWYAAVGETAHVELSIFSLSVPHGPEQPL